MRGFPSTGSPAFRWYSWCCPKSKNKKYDFVSWMRMLLRKMFKKCNCLISSSALRWSCHWVLPHDKVPWKHIFFQFPIISSTCKFQHMMWQTYLWLVERKSCLICVLKPPGRLKLTPWLSCREVRISLRFFLYEVFWIQVAERWEHPLVFFS